MTTPVGPKLISCRICGVIMVKFSKDVCQNCYTQEEELFQRVKDFLRANPGVTIGEVAKAVQTDDAHIEYFIASGRLERVGLLIAHTCQTCNKTIKAGLICPECSKELKEKVTRLQQELKKPGGDGSGLGGKGDPSGLHTRNPRKT